MFYDLKDKKPKNSGENWVAPNAVVIGSPGKVIREVTDEEKKAVDENTKHYQDNWKRYSQSIF